jgi:hypothetical protein
MGSELREAIGGKKEIKKNKLRELIEFVNGREGCVVVSCILVLCVWGGGVLLLLVKNWERKF